MGQLAEAPGAGNANSRAGLISLLMRTNTCLLYDERDPMDSTCHKGDN